MLSLSAAFLHNGQLLRSHMPREFSSDHTVQLSLLADSRVILVFDMGEVDFEVLGLSESEVKQWKLDARLFMYAREGDLDHVKRLISEGADPNYRVPFGTTPVVLAASRGHLAVVQYLVSRGAAIDAIDGNGYDIFEHSQHHPDVLEYLNGIR